MEKKHIPLIVTILIVMLLFGTHFLINKNWEFIMYVGVIIIFFIIIFLSLRKVNYTMLSLWGLVLWAFMHMAGGAMYFGGNLLYNIMLFPLTADIFRYDQLVHIIGFGVSTLVMFDLLKPHLKPKAAGISLGIVIVMAGLGVGAVNEIIEFIATVAVPSTGVGGYMNTMLDLCADLLGGLIALIIIKKQKSGSSTLP